MLARMARMVSRACDMTTNLWLVLPCTAMHCSVLPCTADCGLDWKYRQVDSGEWDVLESLVSAQLLRFECVWGVNLPGVYAGRGFCGSRVQLSV